MSFVLVLESRPNPTCSVIRNSSASDNTVFIVTSDHGDMQMEHQQFYKMVPYDASASVPMVIYDARQQVW